MVQARKINLALTAVGAITVFGGIALSVATGTIESASAASQVSNLGVTAMQMESAKAAPTSGGLVLRKDAYLNVADRSSIDAVEATGTLIPAGVNVPTGAEVCFVYTVTNKSEYEMVLDSLRESDRRIGDDGLLGGAGIVLAPGDDWRAFDCTTLKYLVIHDFDD